MEKIYRKDKKDFLTHYEDDDFYFLREFIFWKDSDIDGKVDIKIAIPCYHKQIKEELNKIKD